MKNFFKYFAGIFLLAGLIIYFLMPSNVNFFDFLWVISLVAILFYVFIPKFLRADVYKGKKINLGVIYFSIMALIIIIGNLSTYVIQYVYPLYDTDLKATNLYWLAGMFCFSIGYLMSMKFMSRRSTKSRTYYHINNNLVIIVFLLALVGTYVAYVSLGFIPFLEGVGKGARYAASTSSTIYDRLWSFCVASAALAYIYTRTVKKTILIYLILISSVVLSLFFIIRMYPFLTFLVLFLLWLKFEQKWSKILLYTSMAIVLFFIFNVAFVDYRSENSFTKVQESGGLNIIQRRFIYGTFNEFGQLKEAINHYDAEPQYGMTLISLPLGFIPGPILSTVGIKKDDILSNNSAVIMAKFLGSKSSGGLRIGILGEFFINFRFYGFIPMVLIGLFIGYLHRKINIVYQNDWRLAFYTIFFGIMVYALIGQIDAIGSLLGNYVLLFLIIKIFSKKKFASEVNENLNSQKMSNYAYGE